MYALAGLLASAAIVSAMLVPKKTIPIEGPEPTPDPGYNQTDKEWDLLALENLIKEVKDSDMQEAAKKPVVTRLERLLEDLKATDKANVMRTHVLQTMRDVDNAVEEVNTYRALAESINKWSSLSSVRNFSVGLVSCEQLIFSEYMTKVRAGIEKAEKVDEEVKTFYLGIRTGLTNGTIAETDMLYEKIHAFTDSLETYATEYGRYMDDKKVKELERCFGSATEEIGILLDEQKINGDVRDYVINRLKEIFQITDAEMQSLELKSEKPLEIIIPEEDEKEGEEGNDGGMGDGNTLSGSDDVIYDPNYQTDLGEVGGYVEYNNVINEYYAVISNLIYEGEIPEDMAQYIEDYFSRLFDATEPN